MSLMRQSVALEASLERSLGEKLKKLGCLWIKWVSPGTIGVPDRILILPGGEVLFVEMKALHNEVTPAQELMLGRLRSMGCEAYVVKGPESCDRFYESIRKRVLAYMAQRGKREDEEEEKEGES